jgi:hypothetical protein
MQVGRREIPSAWADDPDAWWEHVANCAFCSCLYERPPDDEDTPETEEAPGDDPGPQSVR